MNELRSRRFALMTGFVVLAAILTALVALFSDSARETVVAYFLPGNAFDRRANVHAGMLVPWVVRQDVRSSDHLAVALAVLSNGPQAADGPVLVSAIPAGSGIRVREVRSGIVQLDVPSALSCLRAGSFQAVLLRAQLEATCRAAVPGMRMLVLVCEGRIVSGFSY